MRSKKNNKLYKGMLALLIFALTVNNTACSKNSMQQEVISSSDSEKNVLYPVYFKDKNKQYWGLMDEKGSYVVQPQYQWIEQYQSNGLTRFTYNNLSGIMDSAGDIIVQPEYHYIYDYFEGVCIGYDGKKYVAINEEGKTLFESDGYIGNFHEGLTWFQRSSENGKLAYGYMDRSGKVVIEPQYSYACDFINGKAIVRDLNDRYYVIDRSGKVVYQSDDKVLYDLNEDILTFYDSASFKFGYMSVDGTIIRNAEFSQAGKFDEGLAVVATADGLFEPKFGIINNKGDFVVEPQYAAITNIGEGMFSVSLRSLAGSFDMFSRKAIMDSSGKLLTEYLYYDIGEYTNGIASVSEDTETYFIDKTGKAVKSLPRLAGAGMLKLKDNVVAAELDEELKYVDLNGKTVWQPNNSFMLESGIVVETQKYRPDRCLLVRYPKLNDMPDKKVEDRLNEELKNYFIGDHLSSELEEDMYVEDIVTGYTLEEIEKLLIIQMDAYMYPIGAVHGITFRQTLHINIENGKLYTLEDLFKKESDYLKIITEIINEEINKENESDSGIYNVESIDIISEDQSFIATEDSLIIYFQPYEIASYAAGFLTFTIPYEKISEIIDTNSEFWNSYN